MSQFLPRVSIMLLVLSLCACASTPPPVQQASDYPEPVFTAKRLLPPEYADQMKDYDPWEGMNKRIYNFNYHFDKAVFLPIVRGYNAVLPQFARTGVHNFFRNFDDMITMFNSVLQVSPNKLFQSTGRVLVNSTVGILGLVDVATMLDFPRPDEDFGQTLGHWGVGMGPYLVLPFLGPSSLRDGIGIVPDFLVRGAIKDQVMSDEVDIGTTILWPIDARANMSFRYYETGSAFEYRMVRWLYSTKREMDVSQ
jgi:phospholipid-binding lipoprotein MlaA